MAANAIQITIWTLPIKSSPAQPGISKKVPKKNSVERITHLTNASSPCGLDAIAAAIALVRMLAQMESSREGGR
jgi:hypothetical protein